MNTISYLKKYAYTYIYVFLVFFLLALGTTRGVRQASSHQAIAQAPVIIIDPGHGGMDGGTTSCTGVSESNVNLQISLRVRDLLHLLGYRTVMTRTEDCSLSTDGSTVREQKRSDLQNRVNAVERQENALLVSIHQNFFPQSQYSGPQIFHCRDSLSTALAYALQEDMNRILAPQSRRQPKIAQGVYLMEQIHCPGILVECGFLSNPKEEALLRQQEYQIRLAGVICGSLVGALECGPVV